MNNIKSWLAVIGGGTLVLYGLTRRPLMGAAFVCSGGYLVYRGLTGSRPLAGRGLARLEAVPRNQFKPGPQGFPDCTIDTADIVDVTAWGSFPASDPPAWV
jgi:hypothetical protein